MKKIALIGLFSLLLNVLGYSQASEIKNIKQVITAFSKAGDNNNVNDLEKHLDQNYRIVMNRLFGSNEVSVMSRSVYLEKIKSKEYGGDSRELSIENVLINGTTASAKVTFKGSKLTFISLITLLKDDKGVWKLVNDVPIIS